MKNTNQKQKHSKKVILLAAFAVTLSAGVLVGCSSDVPKHQYSASTNVSEEMNVIQQDLQDARSRQVDVLSPENYQMAQTQLDNAKEAKDKNKDNEKVLEHLGYARAYLDRANTVATNAQKTFSDVLKARNDALVAKAPSFASNELKKADEDFTSETHRYEKKEGAQTDSEQITKIQKEFLFAELKSIKASNLDETRGIIAGAKKDGAEKYASQTLNSAQAKLQAAEATIDTDRHNQAAIQASVAQAHREANRLAVITQTARDSKGKTPEEIAIAIQKKETELQSAESATMATQAQLNSTQNQLNSTQSNLANTNQELASTGKQLADTEKFNQNFETARSKFSPTEAEVYRDGDKLVIRLKSVKFKSGQSDLPKDSLESLGKVKDVIAMMNAQKVLVEGHTDSVGSAQKNMKLSEDRAQSVAQYFTADNAIDSSKVETKGDGYNKPLRVNKKAEDRAINRRVDVTITPASSSL